jgi:hypothetical protein
VPDDERAAVPRSAGAQRLASSVQAQDLYAARLCGLEEHARLGYSKLEPKDRTHRSPHHLWVVRVNSKVPKHDTARPESFSRAKQRAGVAGVVQVGEDEGDAAGENLVEFDIPNRCYAHQARWRIKIGDFSRGAIVDKMHWGAILLEFPKLRIAFENGFSCKDFVKMNVASSRFLEQRRAFKCEPALRSAAFSVEQFAHRSDAFGVSSA